MKKKERQELHQKSKKELEELIKKVSQELVKLKMEKEAGKLKNIHLLVEKKRQVAIIKTILKEKELGL